MKKLSFFLMAMLFSVMSFAAEAKFDWSGITTTQSPTVANVYTQGDVTLTFDKASGSNIPAENKEGSIRMYKGTTLKIVVAGENNVITNVAFTCTGTSYAATNLQYNGEALPSNEWALTTPAAEILLNAVANARFKSIVVTYGQVAADYIAAPAISGDVDFIESTEVSIAAGEGLKVYYTLDGTDPTNASPEYTASFEVKETTTVKAIAYNGENASEVTTQTFTKATQVTCAEAKEIALKVSGNNVPTELTYVVKGYVTNIVADWKSGKQTFWIADTKDGGNVFEAYYCFISEAVTLGDYVQLFGKLTKYNTTPEMADGQATILPEPAPEPVMYTVTATAENGTVEGAGEYEEGKEATLTATANEGYEFVNWTVDGAEVSTENPYTFVVTANVALVANFKEVVVEPTTETVYFVNAANWTTVNVYAWTTDPNASWPGVAATKEAEQIAGYDVYSYTVEAGTYANVIFNNGSGQQTADLVWTAGKYYVKDGWYTKEEAEAKLAAPVEYESVYFVDNQGWGKANIYTWTPEVGTWPGVPMTKEAEQLAGYDVYSYTVEKGTTFGGMLFNNASGVQTGDLKWTAGKYYVKDAWYTKEEAIEKLSGPVTPPVITYVLMGVKGDWKTGIAMTQNPDNANEYVLLGQEILEGDSVKVVTLTDGVATAWCGNVDEYSSVEYTNAEGNGNIVLAPGKYDFYYKVAEDLIYIGGEAYEPEIEWLEMPLEITNLTTAVMEVEGAKYLQLMGRDDMNDADVTLFLNNYADVDDDYEVNAESSYMTFGGMELTVLEGVMTQTSETDKGTMYNGIVRTYVAEDSLYVAFNLTMYAAPATVLELTDAIVAINEDLGTLTFNVPTGEGEGYFVELSGYTAPGVHEGPQICLFETPEVVAYTNYAETSVADGVITLKGEFTSFMGAKFDLTISGKLPVVEEPEPLKMAGVVKRAVQNGDEVIVLTHEEDGTAHIYQVVDGKPVAELSQEGVIARDPENAGDLLAISDIAVTEDGKLIATNYMITQSGDDQVAAGDKRGETRIYIWDDLAGDPSIMFTSKMSSNWFQSKQGLTMAVKGTSDNMEILMTGIHKSKAWARVSSYRVIDGVYVEPDVNHNDHYFFYDVNDAIALETTVGTQYELNASPLGEMNWVLDAELINPTEIVESATNNVEIATSVALIEDLGKKYNGATYVTVDNAALMVAPFANPDGQLVGAEILNITNGFDAPQYVDMVYVDEAVAATAAATAVEVVEGGLNITLVADATIHTWFLELNKEPEYQVYEDEITNLVIDLDNLVLIGGPSSAFQVDVFLGLGEYNRNDDTYQLLPESSIAVMGSDATFIDGYAYEVDAFTPSAKAVVHCEWNGMLLEFHLTMTAEPMEATKVVVENATVEIEKYVIFGDVYDYALKMSGEWINPEDGLTYPVLVEVPVYYPEATEPSEIMSTVTVGGWGDNDPWLGFGEGTLTVTTVDNVVTATGIVQNPMAGVAIDITISGTITPTGVENATVTVKPVKMIQNGLLIIEKDGVQYNAQGATLK